MIELIHVSDPHFHSSRSDNARSEEFFDSVERHLFGEYSYLLITGDITDDGLEQQYKNAEKCLSRFGLDKILLCPGNHDCGTQGTWWKDEDRARLFDEYLGVFYRCNHRYFPKGRPLVRELLDSSGNKVLTIGVNATSVETKLLDPGTWFARGRVGESQLKAVSVALSDDRYKESYKIVYNHFHPFDNVGASPASWLPTGLEDAGSLLRATDRNGVMLLCGHDHSTGKWSSGKTGLRMNYILAADSAEKNGERVAWVIRMYGEKEDLRVVKAKLSGNQWVMDYV